MIGGGGEEAQGWQAETFGGTRGMRRHYGGVDLPDISIGLNLSYNPDAGGAPRRGRRPGHVGLEVNGLDRFCQQAAWVGVTIVVARRGAWSSTCHTAAAPRAWATRS